MKQIAPLAAVILTLSACATMRTAGAGSAVAGSTDAAERITYDTGACFGMCPVYSVTVDTASGAGEFIGTQHTATSGAARLVATPAQVRGFRDAVAALRMVDGEGVTKGGARCSDYATDMPGVTVTWIGAGGARAVKRAYFGCAMDANRVLFASLRSVPDVLAIRRLIEK